MTNTTPQMPLFQPPAATPGGPVTCLGLTFADEAARRAHFTALLRQKLQDPAFRQIEGFPIGEDDDILALSDPPYYTACPNPWLADFVAEWEAQKPPQPADTRYHREPFAADVSEGKNDPIYNAHSYHTKVPHKAIMRYILHYTEPGDIVFDGFCGTGMTGVAAQMCGDRQEVESLGYQVEADGTILQIETDENGKNRWVTFSKLGARRVVLNDLSPAATFIAYNYNTPTDIATFEKEVQRILAEVEKEYGWMYETWHPSSDETSRRKGKINYTVWSDVFICSNCSTELVFWDVAIDRETGGVKPVFQCQNCKVNHVKHNLEHAQITVYDRILGETIKKAKQKAVLINYSVGRDRYEKSPDEHDLSVIQRVEQQEFSMWYPTTRIDGDLDIWYERDYRSLGVYSVDSFFTTRNLRFLSILWAKSDSVIDQRLAKAFQFALTGMQVNLSRMNRWRANVSFPYNPLSGTLYIGALQSEANVLTGIQNKIKRLVSSWESVSSKSQAQTLISTQSLSGSIIQGMSTNSVDYIFIDPPFGSNIIYSDLSILWEAWINIFTNTKSEAVVHRRKKVNPTTLWDYMKLMTISFKEAYRVLKPGHWMTVEFSNTKAAVWNSIQTALIEAGFIVANVSALDKQQGSFKAVTTPTAVKQDLVITAYKPNGGFEERFLNEATSEEGVWDFVRTHLSYLPVTKQQNGMMQIVPERDPRILFDQMIAYYVRKGFPIPLSSQEFQQGLRQRFPERDGMVFLPEQVAEYDKKRLAHQQIEQASLFVSDESSAIQWLRQLLKTKPLIFRDINSQFMQQLSGWSKNEVQLNLDVLLDQNFICYDGRGPVPEQIHAYLSSNWKEMRNLPKNDPTLVAKAKDRWYVPDPNKQADLERLRERGLLREFETYKDTKQRQLKQFRLEAVRAGFKQAWQAKPPDYHTIITIARKIPSSVLEEDPKLLMWYDAALTRTGQAE